MASGCAKHCSSPTRSPAAAGRPDVDCRERARARTAAGGLRARSITLIAICSPGVALAAAASPPSPDGGDVGRCDVREGACAGVAAQHRRRSVSASGATAAERRCSGVRGAQSVAADRERVLIVVVHCGGETTAGCLTRADRRQGRPADSLLPVGMQRHGAAVALPSARAARRESPARRSRVRRIERTGGCGGPRSSAGSTACRPAGSVRRA